MVVTCMFLFLGGLTVWSEPKEPSFHFLVFTDVFGNQTHGVVLQYCRPVQVRLVLHSSCLWDVPSYHEEWNIGQGIYSSVVWWHPHWSLCTHSAVDHGEGSRGIQKWNNALICYEEIGLSPCVMSVLNLELLCLECWEWVWGRLFLSHFSYWKRYMAINSCVSPAVSGELSSAEWPLV